MKHVTSVIVAKEKNGNAYSWDRNGKSPGRWALGQAPPPPPIPSLSRSRWSPDLNGPHLQAAALHMEAGEAEKADLPLSPLC